MSLYADYLREITCDKIIECEQGFATYRYLDGGKTVYIVDIFVVPESRTVGIMSYLADQVVREAKARGCTELLGTVRPSNKNSTGSLKALLGYGMTLKDAGTDYIVLTKDIIHDSH